MGHYFLGDIMIRTWIRGILFSIGLLLATSESELPLFPWPNFIGLAIVIFSTYRLSSPATFTGKVGSHFPGIQNKASLKW